MIKKIKNQSGVALILVMTSLLILTTLVVDFAYSTHVASEVAASQRDRLKAYYLARSGLNFLKLQLFVEKKLRSQFASMLQQMQGSGVTSAPLCSQIPLSSGLLRQVAAGDDPFASKDEPKPEGEDQADKKSAKKKETKSAGANDTFEGLSHSDSEFLQFDGDFEGNCQTEETKMNLNLFRVPPAAVPAQGAGATAIPAPVTAGMQQYEEQKNFLLALLSQPQFDFLATEDRKKLVNAIADWVDANDRINESPGVEGALEESEYNGSDIKYKVKNGRFASLQELLLVAGMTDDIFEAMKDSVTVYGDQKINLCQATDQTVRAFVLKFVQSSAGAIVLDPKDEQRWTIIATALKLICEQANPQPNQVAAAIATALGQGTEGGAQGLAGRMASQITTTNRFFRLEGTGSVNQATVRIQAVVDTASSNPTAWKTLYFQVE